MNQCPWTQFDRDPYPFCEEALCAWIREPANTWTNIGYLIVGILLWRKRKEHNLYYYFSFASIFLAFGSGIFHMSNAIWGKKLDVMAMYLVSSTSIFLSLQKRISINERNFFLGFLCLNIIGYPLIGWGKAGGIFFLLQVIFVILHEITYAQENPLSTEKKNLLIKIVCVFFGSFTLSQLDQTGILCDPKNHILTGHGIWHLGTAYCIFLVSEYFYSAKK